MITIPCNSWIHYKEQLDRYSKRSQETRDHFIFRGHADSDWKLESTLDREFSTLTPGQRINTLGCLIKDFKSEVLGTMAEVSNLSITNYDNIMAELFGRHFGLPTTVLDWSKSPYISAYFAFASTTVPKNGKVCIWAFNRQKIADLGLPDEFILDDTSLIFDNTRALAQRGVFMKATPDADLESDLDSGLAKFTIPFSERRNALSDLDEMKINARSLFQTPDSAAQTAIIRQQLR